MKSKEKPFKLVRNKSTQNNCIKICQNIEEKNPLTKGKCNETCINFITSDYQQYAHTKYKTELKELIQEKLWLRKYALEDRDNDQNYDCQNENDSIKLKIPKCLTILKTFKEPIEHQKNLVKPVEPIKPDEPIEPKTDMPTKPVEPKRSKFNLKSTDDKIIQNWKETVEASQLNEIKKIENVKQKQEEDFKNQEEDLKKQEEDLENQPKNLKKQNNEQEVSERKQKNNFEIFQRYKNQLQEFKQNQSSFKCLDENAVEKSVINLVDENAVDFDNLEFETKNKSTMIENEIQNILYQFDIDKNFKAMNSIMNCSNIQIKQFKQFDQSQKDKLQTSLKNQKIYNDELRKCFSDLMETIVYDTQNKHTNEKITVENPQKKEEYFFIQQIQNLRNIGCLQSKKNGQDQYQLFLKQNKELNELIQNRATDWLR